MFSNAIVMQYRKLQMQRQVEGAITRAIVINWWSELKLAGGHVLIGCMHATINPHQINIWHLTKLGFTNISSLGWWMAPNRVSMIGGMGLIVMQMPLLGTISTLIKQDSTPTNAPSTHAWLWAIFTCICIQQPFISQPNRIVLGLKNVI